MQRDELEADNFFTKSIDIKIQSELSLHALDEVRSVAKNKAIKLEDKMQIEANYIGTSYKPTRHFGEFIYKKLPSFLWLKLVYIVIAYIFL